MSIIEKPVVTLLTFQVWDTDAGAWRDLKTYATDIAIKRGGQRSGASSAMQVGTLDATLFGALNLAGDAALRPNSPIRVVRKATPARQLWNLRGTAFTTTAIGVNPSVQLADTLSITASNVQPRWTVNAPLVGTTQDININAGALFLTSQPARDITNRAPDVFIPGAKYTVNATASDSAGNVGTALVVYTGSRQEPTIIAQGATRTPSTTSKAYPPLVFTVPSDQAWSVGAVVTDAVALTAATTGTVIQSMIFTRFDVSTTGMDQPEFTGLISDIQQSVELTADGGRNTFTSVSAVDAVQSLANTDRNGAVSRGGAGYQDFPSRIDQLSDSALVPMLYGSSADPTVYTWSGATSDAWDWGFTGGGNPSTGTSTALPGPAKRIRFARTTSSNTAAGAVAPYIRKTFRNLDTNSTYAFAMDVALTELTAATLGDFALRYVNGSKVQVSDVFTLGAVGDRITFGFTFKPTSTSGTLEMRANTSTQLASGTTAPAFALTYYGFTLTQIGDKKGYTLADTAMQTDLATHLDIACNTVNGRWWVSKSGMTVVSRQLLLNTPLATLTDDNSGDVSYTGIERAYDTRNVVNVLRVNNHGRDAATGNAADVTTSFTSDSSIRRWGARASDIDVSMYVGGAHAPDLTMRAQEIMGKLSRPRYSVSSVTFNVQSNPAVLELLELRAPIRVRYEDMDLTGRVLAIKHQITPTRWLVTVDIDEVTGGPTFADFSAANSGTFADWNVSHAGKTFNQLNADPLS